MRQRLIGAGQKADAGPFAQLGQQSSRSVQVSSIGVGRVGPHRFIDDLCGFLRVNVQRSFHEVGLLADLTVAGVANGSGFRSSAVLVLEDAAERGCGIDLSVRSEGLRLEFFEKTLAVVVDGSGRR